MAVVEPHSTIGRPTLGALDQDHRQKPVYYDPWQCPRRFYRTETNGDTDRNLVLPCRSKSCPGCRPSWNEERIRHYIKAVRRSDALWLTERSPRAR